MTGDLPAKRPQELWIAVIVMYVQTAFNLGGAALLLDTADEMTRYGEEAPELYLLGWVSAVIGMVLLSCAIMLTNGVSWARVLVAVVEGLGVVSGLVAVASGAVANIVNIGLCALVLYYLFSYEVQFWFTPRQHRPATEPVPWQHPPVDRPLGVEPPPGSAEWWGAPPERNEDRRPPPATPPECR